ncbi:hypothetical protein DRE_00277 [Drechslerella stenobrocha 248]|uniref:AAA+ ATPase domain-containing protein n=1 Tax=Drechslerella stenobrocha 248 TaxID=1043628 RepID=W7IA61_9PEZI|nr:hypothetical protein DRE_00277 [Drechslerella stenobrocha 248]
MMSGPGVKLMLQNTDGTIYQLPLELLQSSSASSASNPKHKLQTPSQGTLSFDKDQAESSGVVDSPPPLPVLDQDSSMSIVDQLSSFEPMLSGLRDQPNGTAPKNKPRDPQQIEKKERASVMEFGRLDNLYDLKRHNFHLVETSSTEKSSNDLYEHYVFVVRRIFNIKNQYQRTLIDIKSTHLRTALANSITNVRGITWTEDKPCCNPNFLFAYEPEIRANVTEMTSTSDPDEDTLKQIAHANLLLTYLDEDFSSDRELFETLVQDNVITYDLLYLLLKPNTIIVTESVLGEPTALSIIWNDYKKHPMKGDLFQIEASYVEYDGKSFRYADAVLEIPAFRGSIPINALMAYPLEYDARYEELKTKLIERGRKFCALQTPDNPNIPGAFRSYQGLAFRRIKDEILKYHVKGRVMIDTLALRRVLPDYPTVMYTKATPKPRQHRPTMQEMDAASFDEYSHAMTSQRASTRSRKLLPDYSISPESMTEDDYLLCPSVVDGFSFNDKLWGQYSVNKLDMVKWDNNAFDCLVLPKNQKTLIRALIESHTKGSGIAKEGEVDFDDIIQGKGQGLVMLLHGKPGLGKTLTAESISETLKRPLYVLSAGDLPPDPSKLEHHLSTVLDVASTWGAVLLIDEADIYLEQRSMNDVVRNALVCVFLRLLEYFRGILILTTNRVRTFDEAFQSRIHVAIAYTDLGLDAKIQIWKTFIKKALESEVHLPLAAVTVENQPNRYKRDDKNNTDAAILADEHYELLARRDLNGRQIKNAVKAAHALATSLGERLNIKHIREVLDVIESFDRTFKGAHTGTLYT